MPFCLLLQTALPARGSNHERVRGRFPCGLARVNKGLPPSAGCRLGSASPGSGQCPRPAGQAVLWSSRGPGTHPCSGSAREGRPGCAPVGSAASVSAPRAGRAVGGPAALATSCPRLPPPGPAEGPWEPGRAALFSTPGSSECGRVRGPAVACEGSLRGGTPAGGLGPGGCELAPPHAHLLQSQGTLAPGPRPRPGLGGKGDPLGSVAAWEPSLLEGGSGRVLYGGRGAGARRQCPSRHTGRRGLPPPRLPPAPILSLPRLPARVLAWLGSAAAAPADSSLCGWAERSGLPPAAPAPCGLQRRRLPSPAGSRSVSLPLGCQRLVRQRPWPRLPPPFPWRCLLLSGVVVGRTLQTAAVGALGGLRAEALAGRGRGCDRRPVFRVASQLQCGSSGKSASHLHRSVQRFPGVRVCVREWAHHTSDLPRWRRPRKDQLCSEWWAGGPRQVGGFLL